jgi:hypothetical protein
MTSNDRKVKCIVRKGVSGEGGSAMATSITWLLLTTGEKVLTIEAGLTVTVGQSLVITSVVQGATHYMSGTVTSYESTAGTLVVQIDAVTTDVNNYYGNWLIDFNIDPLPIWYTGWLMPDQYIDDIQYVKQISLVFNDQLRLLSSKLYTVNGLDLPTDSGGNFYTDFDLIINQLFNILDKTDLDLDICVANNLFEATNMTTAATDDPFNQASVNQDRWYS